MFRGQGATLLGYPHPMRGVLITVAFLLAAPAAAEDVREELPNGLRLHVEEDRRAPLVAVELCYDVGQRDEPAGRTPATRAYRPRNAASRRGPGAWAKAASRAASSPGGRLAMRSGSVPGPASAA